MPSKKILVNLDMTKNQLENVVVHKSSTEPSSPTAGQLWYDSGSSLFKYHDGTQWVAPAITEGHLYALSGSGTTVKLTQDSGTAGNAGSYTIPAASANNAGTMSSSDFSKLAGIAAGATANTGTVTSVATSNGITGGTITTTGTIQHSTANGYKHIPSTTTDTAANAYVGRGTNAGEGAWIEPDSSPQANSTKLITSGAVATAISAIGSPMVFKGTVGTKNNTNGTYTWANLPAASSSNVGWTLKAISTNTGTPAAKEGDTIVSRLVSGTTYEWTVIPSGDEPSGTVTSISAGTGLTASPSSITTTGTISHATGSGYQHLPTGGSSGNVLRWATNNAGTWEAVDTTVTASSSNLVTSGAVKTAINGIAHPEQISRATFTIGTSATTGEVNINTGKTIFAVTAMMGNAGVVADWKYESGKVTVTLAAQPSSTVTVNVLYYGGSTVASVNQFSYVVDEQSTSSTNEKWKWRKWSNGEVELWGECKHSGDSFTQTQNGWFTGARQDTFPSGLFNAAPFICQLDVRVESGAGVCGLEKTSSQTQTTTQQYYAYRVDGSGSSTYWTQIYAKGTYQ